MEQSNNLSRKPPVAGLVLAACSILAFGLYAIKGPFPAIGIRTSEGHFPFAAALQVALVLAAAISYRVNYSRYRLRHVALEMLLILLGTLTAALFVLIVVFGGAASGLMHS